MPANMICQWGTLRYLKWFGPCRVVLCRDQGRGTFLFVQWGFTSYVACVSFLSVEVLITKNE